MMISLQNRDFKYHDVMEGKVEMCEHELENVCFTQCDILEITQIQ